MQRVSDAYQRKGQALSASERTDSLRGVELSPLHERLHEVFGNRSFRAIAESTSTSHETVRRYMQGQAPSVEFLEAVCRVAGVNGQWLLTGRGPKNSEHIRAHALREANVSELLTAMARTLEKLQERVDRLEVYMQSLETRLRAAAQADEEQGASRLPGNLAGPASRVRAVRPAGSARRTSEHEQSPSASAPAPVPGTGVEVVSDPLHRARSLADALPERPPADAG